jgi:bacterioferritin-associated ferredoxin
MYVCVCNGISDKDLRKSFDGGAKTPSDLQMQTGCGTCCGSCMAMVDSLIKEWGPSVQYTPAGEPALLTLLDPVSPSHTQVALPARELPSLNPLVSPAETAARDDRHKPALARP